MNELLRKLREARMAKEQGDRAGQQYALNAALTEADVVISGIAAQLQQEAAP